MIIIIDFKKCDFKKLRQRNVENMNNYDYNQAFTNESDFDIKLPITDRYVVK